MTEDIFKLISGERPSKKIRQPQTFRLGDGVRVMSGAFAGFRAKIEGINKSKSLLLVSVSILERAQFIKINFTDAENE
jgi:transcription antitermination factor NusG